MPHTMTKESPAMQQCIKDCRECERVCKETMAHCLKMGGKHAETEHIGSLKDCVETCKLSTDFMERDSHLSPKACQLCAEACDRCAESCESVDPSDSTMKSCAEMCRRCAESCRKMS